MKKNILLVFLVFFCSYTYSQKIVSMEDFEDNKESYVGKTIKIRVGYNNRANGCQLRVICAGDKGKHNGKWILWKKFYWLDDPKIGITINIPNKFFENEGKSMPNVTDGGFLEATVYVYNAWNCKVCADEGYVYNNPIFENPKVITLELVSIKRIQ